VRRRRRCGGGERVAGARAAGGRALSRRWAEPWRSATVVGGGGLCDRVLETMRVLAGFSSCPVGLVTCAAMTHKQFAAGPHVSQKRTAGRVCGLA
jgi:hypothetical protein